MRYIISSGFVRDKDVMILIPDNRLVKEYADRQGVTEQLKAENQLEWVVKMNNIRACVREVIEREIIYT